MFALFAIVIDQRKRESAKISALCYINIFIFLNNRTRSVSPSMTVNNEYLKNYMVTTILRIIEMTLLKYLTKREKSFPKTNTM